MYPHQKLAERMQISLALQTVGENAQRLFIGRRSKIRKGGRPAGIGVQSLNVKRPWPTAPTFATGAFVDVTICNAARVFHKFPLFLRPGRSARRTSVRQISPTRFI